MRLSTIGLMLTLALGILWAPLAAQAQPAGKIPRLGYLMVRSGPTAYAAAFMQGLRELGWIEGQTMAIEYRWAAGQMDRLPALAEELVRLRVDVIVASATPGVQAAKNATSTGSCWIPGSWMCRWRTTRLLSPSPP